MSALGQKQTSRHLQPMSALPPIADNETQSRDVRFVPKADMPCLFDHLVGGEHRQAAGAANETVGMCWGLLPFQHSGKVVRQARNRELLQEISFWGGVGVSVAARLKPRKTLGE
jgi:hypothetical protein